MKNFFLTLSAACTIAGAGALTAVMADARGEQNYDAETICQLAAGSLIATSAGALFTLRASRSSPNGSLL